MNKSKWLIIGALGLVLLAAGLMMGCPSTYSGGNYANVDVHYSINGDSLSSNADKTLDYTLPGPGTDFKQLTWYCGDYNGHRRSQVDLTFKKENNTWVLDKDEYSGGHCS